MAHSPAVRVAVTLEQCWHAVPGGTAVAALRLVDALVARGDIEVVGVSARHRHEPPAAFRPGVAVQQLNVPRVVLYEGWRRLRWPDVQDATGPVHLVHATTLLVPPRRRVPLVVTIHDLAFRHDAAQFTRRGVQVFTDFLAIVRRDADLVLCSSRATLADCVDAGIDPDRLRHVPLAVDPPAPTTPEAVAAFRARHGLPDTFVLFVGTVEPRKNLPRLAAAAAAVGVPLVVVGPEGWGDVALPGDVRRLGFLDAGDLACAYAAASVFAYPSLREGFGLPVLEAMHAGCPVVTSAGTSTAEVAGDAGVLVEATDVDAIADGLRRALDDAPRLRAAGPARAATFSWSRTAELTVEAYREARRRVAERDPRGGER